MGNLRRYYYENKIKIWKIILIIASFLIIFRILNYMAIKNAENPSNVENNVDTSIGKNNLNTNTFIESEKSAITGDNISSNVLNEANKVIEEFISDCNNKEIEKAYNLLSTDCKQILYPNVEEFQNRYVNVLFGNNKKIATIENWSGNTYKVNIKEDIMSSGNINATSMQDYFTLVSENGQTKLNIKEFIDKEDINKQETIENIVFNTVSKEIYFEYEIYTIKVENKTSNTILLDDLQSTQSIYLLGDNDTKYYAYTNELINNLLKINSGFSTEINIKFNKKYNTRIRTESMVFSNIILDVNSNEQSKRITANVSM